MWWQFIFVHTYIGYRLYNGFKANVCKTLLYSRFQAKLCRTFLALVWLISLSACSNASDTQLGSHTNDVLSIGATEIIGYGHKTSENTIEYQTFFERQKFVFSGVLWPYTLISVAPIGNTSWVCDLRWESYALEQAERPKSHARANKVVHTFAWNPLYHPAIMPIRYVSQLLSLFMVLFLFGHVGAGHDLWELIFLQFCYIKSQNCHLNFRIKVS